MLVTQEGKSVVTQFIFLTHQSNKPSMVQKKDGADDGNFCPRPAPEL